MSNCSTDISYQNTREVNFTRSLISTSYHYQSHWHVFPSTHQVKYYLYY